MTTNRSPSRFYAHDPNRPCNTCPLFATCKEHETACGEFYAYVEGRDKASDALAYGRHPLREWFEAAFCFVDDCEDDGAERARLLEKAKRAQGKPV